MTQKILNIGCGNKLMEDAVNLDWIKLKGVDVIHNLEEIPFPFKNNEFDEVHAHHILEHIDNFVKVIEEIHRILKPNGLFIVTVPYYTHKDTFTDPTHKRGFTKDSFQYFEEDCDLSFYTKARFKIDEKELIYNSSFWFTLIPFKILLSYLLWNIIKSIRFEMRAVK